ncbi:MAG: radical SAM protein, partial [Bacteroidetes bacterium]
MFAIKQSVAPASDFVLQDFEPAYMQAYRRGQLQERAELALKELEDCCVCPRNCHVNRLLDEKRVCNTGR